MSRPLLPDPDIFLPPHSVLGEDSVLMYSKILFLQSCFLSLHSVCTVSTVPAVNLQKLSLWLSTSLSRTAQDKGQLNCSSRLDLKID